MGNANRGKQFEQVIKEAFLRVPGTSVIRLLDPTNGYMGIRNICDFIVYKYPHQYLIECKSVHENTFRYSTKSNHITDTQWEGLLEAGKIKGVVSGVIVWYVLKDVTKFYPIWKLKRLKDAGKNSVRYDDENGVVLCGVKKRVFFDYDMQQFFDEVSL